MFIVLSSDIPCFRHENIFEHAYGVAVGERGDIIAHDAVARVGLEQGAIKFGHLLGVFHKVGKERFEHHGRFFLFALGVGIGVNGDEHKVVQLAGHLVKEGRLLDKALFVTCLYEVGYHIVDAYALARTEHFHAVFGQVALYEYARALRVLYVVIDIGEAVGIDEQPTFERGGLVEIAVVGDPVAHFIGKIESLAVVFQDVDHAQRVQRMDKASLYKFVQDAFARVTERRMPQIVSHRHRLGQIFVEAQGARHRARYLSHFERVRETGAVMVAFGREKDLRLVF